MSLLTSTGSASQLQLDDIRTELHNGSLLDRETQQRRASLQNLDDEDRIDAINVSAFQASVCASTETIAMDRIRSGCAGSKLALEVSAQDHSRVEGDWYLYRPKDWFKFLQRTGPSTSPSLRIHSQPTREPQTLSQSLGTTRDGSVKAFWVTTYRPADANLLPDRLGLAHFNKPAEIYSVTTPIGPGRPAYIPTCTDADAWHAWRRPGPAHTEPWGMTMHLATGAESEPELLLTDHAADERVAHYVGPLTVAPSTAYLAKRLGI